MTPRHEGISTPHRGQTIDPARYYRWGMVDVPARRVNARAHPREEIGDKIVQYGFWGNAVDIWQPHQPQVSGSHLKC